MKHRLPPLDSLKAFESAARHLSFSVAADELCISKGAMSYQIRKLEEQVQCALFKRSVRQVYLTDAGQALLQTTKTMFQELDETLHRLHGESHQAGASIASTTYVAARWLSPRISAFNERYPNIPIKLLHSINIEDYKLADVDIAIQWGPCHRKTDRSQLHEIPMPLFPALAPAIMSKHAIETTSQIDISAILNGPLSNVQLLCEERHQDLWNEWIDAAYPDSHAKLSNPRRTISDANVRVQAAIDGQGIILADGLMDNEINNGLLIQPFKECLNGYGYAIKSSPSRMLSTNAKVLKTWFSDEL